MSQDEKWSTLWKSSRLAMTGGKVEEAETLLCKTLEIAENFEIDDKRLVATLEALAEINFLQRRFAQAEPVCKRVIMLYERKFGHDHADVGTFINNLGLIYHHQKKLFMAETEYQKALAIQTKVLGQAHPQTINVMSNYSRLLKESHRMSEARHMDGLIQGAHTEANWTQSGTYKAYVVASADQLRETVTKTESIKRAPTAVAPPKRRTYNAIEEEITLQDISLPNVLTRPESVSPSQVQSAPASQAQQSQTITGIQRLIIMRREICAD
jgi:tetratricopeptide (TPR) repeat protein